MSIQSTYASHADARKAGWFSRRHQTNAAHQAAQDVWRDRQERKAEREVAALAEAEEWKARARAAAAKAKV